MRSVWAAIAAVVFAIGCVSTTTSERMVGDPTSVVHQDLLPGPPELEALLTRGEGAIALELSRVRWCRRQVVTSVQRETVEKSRLGTGTAIVSTAMMALGIAAASAVPFLAGGGVLAIGLLQTGTTTTPLPREDTPEPAERVVCRREPATRLLVQVMVAGVIHEAISDARGRVRLSDVGAGPVSVAVDGVTVRTREDASAPKRVAAPRPKPPPEQRQPEPTTLPPPPPPPPGVRLFPE